MEHTPVFCPSHTWKGPSVSTFSSEWDDNLNSYLMAPDVIKPPPQFQDPEDPCQSPPASSTVIRRRDKEMVKAGTKPKERRSRPTSAIEPHKRSLSLSTAITSNKVVTPRRCESYALSYSSSSSEDSGSDSTPVRTGDHLPDAVPQHRARSIVLKKAKRKPTPPARTVSLHRLTESKHPERRTQSLYIPNDSQNLMLLPDLIPVCKKEVSESDPSTLTAEAPVKISNQSLISHRSLKEQRLSEQCKSFTSSLVGDHVNEATKGPYNSDCNNSPTSTRSSPSQPSISSPTRLAISASHSSGYSNQCDTPTQSISTMVGPSPLGCRMRPKHFSSVPGQKAKNCKSRLSLQLPEVQPAIPNPDPSLVLPKTIRRYSDASRPKQGGSKLVMPVVTQQDLNNVRLRSISSSDLDSGVIAEAKEQDASSVTTQSSPKSKPPVAPKPVVSKWPPSAVTVNDCGTCSEVHPPVTNTNAFTRQEGIYSTVNKVKPNAILSHSSNASSDHKQMQRFPEHINVTNCVQSQCSTEDTNALPFKTPTDGNQSTQQRKTRAQGPPVSKRPTLVYTNCENISILEKLEKHAEPTGNYEKPRSPQQEYHVTVYGFIPNHPHASETQPNAAVTPEHAFYENNERQMPETEAVPSSHTTEDLFTIIHRSKRKLFGRKDSFDNKQGDFGTQGPGGVSKTASQNDNFMALLRRTRSAKASCGSRISATELLKSSKPAAAGATDLTTYKKHNMMHSHCP